MFKQFIIRASSVNPLRSTLSKATFATVAPETATTTSIQEQEPQQASTIESANSSSSSNLILPNSAAPAPYVLASLRSFPSLEAHSIIPVHTKFLNEPLRRDLLWSAVVMELDNRRVGASNPPGRGDHKFGRRKLMKQKGSGKARVGDANSPIRWRGAYALARTAPNDFSSTLPKKVYHRAYRVAFSDYFRRGKLYVIGEDPAFNEEFTRIVQKEVKLSQGDSSNLEIVTPDYHAISRFIKTHGYERLNVLLIVDDYEKVSNLREAIKRYPSNKVRIMRKEDVEVRDILKAHRVLVEKDAFTYYGGKYTSTLTL